MEWTPKDPDATVRYVIEWGEIAPDTIESFTLTVATGTVTIGDADNDDTNVYALISGGADGETATFDHTITTTLGQVLPRAISLRIVADADVLSPDSSITKGAITVRALGKLGIANYVFDTEAEEDVSALRQLDSMAARWQSKLEPFGYRQPDTNGTSLPSDQAGIEEADVDAFISNLAVLLAPDYGKTPAGVLNKQAAESRSEMFTRYARRVEYQLPNRTPTGAGNDRYRRFFNGC